MSRLFGVRSGDQVTPDDGIAAIDTDGDKVPVTAQQLAGITWKGSLLTGYYLAGPDDERT